MAADHVGGEKSTVGCLDVARYAVAAAVTALIVTVTAYAAVLLLRREDLSLVVVRGSVSVERNKSEPSLVFPFKLNAINFSGRARLYFTDIIGTISGRDAAGTERDFIQFSFRDMAVAQQSTITSEAMAHSRKEGMDASYFDMLYNNSTASIHGAMVRLNGTLTVGLYSMHNESGIQTVYYCTPITVGGDPSEREEEEDDVLCTENPPATLPASS